MITGRLYIDGDDAYKKYGVYVLKGGWNDLVAFPPLKTVPSNDWQEEDGIEADLSNPVLNTKEVQLKVAFSGAYSRFASLIDHLSDGAYHTFECVYIGRVYRLRLVSQPNMAIAQTLETATLKFANDFPLDGYSYKAPDSSVIPSEDYKFDGLEFTDYGVRVLKGTLAEVKKMPTVKTNLLRNLSHLSGAIYDGGQVTFKTKDVKIFCLMRAESIDELWRNWDALLFDLIRPGEHLLWVDALEQEFPFHYKSCQVTEFYSDGRIWLNFTLTVTFTKSLRLKATQEKTTTVRFVNSRSMLRLTGNGSFRFN